MAKAVKAATKGLWGFVFVRLFVGARVWRRERRREREKEVETKLERGSMRRFSSSVFFCFPFFSALRAPL